MKFHVIFTNINIHFIPQPILWGWVDGTPIWNLCILPCVAKPIVHSILSYVSIFLSTHHMHHIHNIHLKSASGDARGRLVCEGWPPTSSTLPCYYIMVWYSMQWGGISRCVVVWQSMVWFVRDGHHLLLSPSSIFRPITSDGQPPLTSCLLVCRRHSCSTYTTLQQLQDCSTGIWCFCRFYTPQWNIVWGLNYQTAKQVSLGE